jgi:hypothetical protein
MVRFDLEDPVLVFAAVCHPGFKHFDWVSGDGKRSRLLKAFVKELCTINGISFESYNYNPQIAMSNKRYIINSEISIPVSSSKSQDDTDLLADDFAMIDDVEAQSSDSVFFFLTFRFVLQVT